MDSDRWKQVDSLLQVRVGAKMPFVCFQSLSYTTGSRDPAGHKVMKYIYLLKTNHLILFWPELSSDSPPRRAILKAVAQAFVPVLFVDIISSGRASDSKK